MALNTESSAVQTHLTLLQGVINRMASNSANCKTLCATLVSTVGAISYAGDKPGGMWIALLPIALFFYLDAMYLSAERGFRKTYNTFVSDLHAGGITEDQLFNIVPPPEYKKRGPWCAAAKSWATCTTYILLTALTFAIMYVVDKGAS